MHVRDSVTSAVLAATILLVACDRSTFAGEPAWAGTGAYRLLVSVEPKPLSNRTSDEMPAELEIDLAAELHKVGVNALPDLRTLQVMRYNPADGSPLKYENYAYARSLYDRPFRWYDATIPYEFPEFADDVSRTNGKLLRENRVRGGYFLNALGEWKRGRLAWTHTQVGNETPLPPIAQPRILMADLNSDGDDDLFLPSTQGSCLVERSFLEHGYARAKLIAVEHKK